MYLDKMTIFKRWAPEGSIWTQWAKPVLFASIEQCMINGALDIPSVGWAPNAERHTMIIADLPGEQGVQEAVALANLGYRPVPLYNGVKGPAPMSVDVSRLEEALILGSDTLQQLSISPDAPPVFILDSRRMKGRDDPGSFDNRWCVFPQDMPSAEFLLKNGITKVIVRSSGIETDLTHILVRYQKKGIAIYLCHDTPPKEITVNKPLHFKSIGYRFKVILGLKRNCAGGFGGKIPEPYESSGGGIYYGIG